LKTQTFTSYQKLIIAILAFSQFTVILDFMVLSPLSAILLDELSITTQQFGMVVSAYAFSAGAAGLLAAGFADRFDRKKLLLFFYSGFILGTLFCGLAPNYHFLLIARIITGIFGGVIGSIVYAIITDLFVLEKRGRVMGFVQMAFAASQILGIPIGLYLANHLGWHSPFLLIVGLSLVVGIIIMIYMKPVNEHLKLQTKQNAFVHMAKTLSNKRYLRGFSATTLLATGGFMLMPFGAAFAVNNLGISIDMLPMVYLVTGIFTMVSGPLSGKLSDKYGKFRMFTIGSLLAAGLILLYTNLDVTPLWMVIAINVVLFLGITLRMISSQALLTAIPEPKDRGAFMGINSSVMQISGGFAAALAGVIVVQGEDGKLLRYPLLGLVVTASILITIALMYFINKMVFTKKKAGTAKESESVLVDVPVVKS
tara:strand:- start:4213 stop:5487 length:1275 start_codon:yes stop_codon:yes gene_type:complete